MACHMKPLNTFKQEKDFCFKNLPWLLRCGWKGMERMQGTHLKAVAHGSDYGGLDEGSSSQVSEVDRVKTYFMGRNDKTCR